MIEHFHKIANHLRSLKFVAVIMAIVFLVVITGIIFIGIKFTSKYHQVNLFLIPSIVGFFWSASAYAFLTMFQYVPSKVSANDKFFARIKTKLHRFWYWFIGVVFLVTTIALLFLSFKLTYIWVRDYVA